jgi:hypothetical protein
MPGLYISGPSDKKEKRTSHVCAYRTPLQIQSSSIYTCKLPFKKREFVLLSSWLAKGSENVIQLPGTYELIVWIYILKYQSNKKK